MTQINTLAERDALGAPPVAAGYKVDISRGERIGRVSSEWFSRPDDERYLSLSALYVPFAPAPIEPPHVPPRPVPFVSRPVVATPNAWR